MRIEASDLERYLVSLEVPKILKTASSNKPGSFIPVEQGRVGTSRPRKRPTGPVAGGVTVEPHADILLEPLDLEEHAESHFGGNFAGRIRREAQVLPDCVKEALVALNRERPLIKAKEAIAYLQPLLATNTEGQLIVNESRVRTFLENLRKEG